MAFFASRSLRSAFSFSRASFGRAVTRSRTCERKWVAPYYTKPKKKKGGSGQAWIMLGCVATSIAGGAVVILGMPEDTIEGLGQAPDKYANENAVKAYILRAYDKVVGFQKSFSEPISEKLLPDQLPPPYQRPYTLVLSLNDLIICTEYDRDKGWTYQKRPGTDALLIGLFELYEIVIFTDEVGMSGSSIVNALDPNQLITYKLFRDATKYESGKHIKDLSGLNRSLNRVIIVDVDKEAVKYQPENAVVMEKWNGDISDKTLWDLVLFLQTIALNEVDDVRPVLDYYKQKGESNILETFKSIKAKVQEEEEILSRYRETQKCKSSGVGKISIYHRSRSRPPSMPVTPAESELPVVDSNISSSNTNTSENGDSKNKSSQSWTEWIGSWVGWR